MDTPTVTYNEFFHQLTGFHPNPFQQRVADALLGEKSVVLRAPTGSGKTWAVVAPFLYSLHCGNPIGDRLLYALPLRSLATSLYDSTLKRAENCPATQHIAKRVRIQTGERRDDPLFEGRVTFTTIDQLLSSYLIQPVGLPKRLGNINAGAILGSLICFDEFHLLEPSKSMATAIEMLSTVAVEHPLSRFVLMTATLSDETLKWLTQKLKAEFIDVPREEVAQLPNEIGKTRYYRWIDEPLTAAAVADIHQGKRSIVIANTVTRAQHLYQDLQSPACRAQLGENTQIRLLHSRFFPKDRQKIESDLDAWFGPKPSVSDVILVATQVIEAGLDFSCDNLHTEVAPMNAIIQRAGRCARRKNETGTVHCYALLTDKQGKPRFGPYQDIQEIVEATSLALAENAPSEADPLRFHDELSLVNHVHTAWELKQLRPLDNLHDHNCKVRKAIDGDNPAAVRQLVRDVSSVNVVITEHPESLDFNRRNWPEMLPVPPTSLYALFRDEAPKAEWVAKSAREVDVGQGGQLEVNWPRLEKSADILTAGWLVALNPQCAKYDAEVGLIIGVGAEAPPVVYRERPKALRYSYKKEDYGLHIRRVCAAGHARDSDNQVAHKRLASHLNVTQETLTRWVNTIYELHDVGKLSKGWQDAVWKWQITKTGDQPEPRPPLAHTDFDPDVDNYSSVPRKPPHAAEGAYAVQPLLYEAFEVHLSDEFYPCYKAALTAITRHHGAFSSRLMGFQLIDNAVSFVLDACSGHFEDFSLADPPTPSEQDEFQEYLLTATTVANAKALCLYFYLVRRLRIADQNSFKEH